MLSESLKETTRQSHSRLESDFDFKTLTQSREHYVKVLKAMYGYYKSVEIELQKFEGEFEKNKLVLKDRLKLPLIKEDLKHFGLSEQDLALLPKCDNVTRITDLYSGMGCLYVLEGSTMGGQLISKALKKSGIASEDRGTAYYNPYKEQTMPNWNHLKTILNELPEQGHAKVINAANETFSTLGSWLKKTVKTTEASSG